MRILIFLFFICISLGFGVEVLAQAPEYQPVVQIPGLDPNNQDTNEYVNALYLLAITVAALLAVVKIIFGGVKWMLSDIVTDKSSAKKDMWGAVMGLLIVLATVLILNTVNPNLTKLNFLENATPLNITLTDPANPASTVKIGDFHGMWCGDIFTLVCSDESAADLERFKESCVNDAHGVIVVKPLDGYVCSQAN